MLRRRCAASLLLLTTTALLACGGDDPGPDGPDGGDGPPAGTPAGWLYTDGNRLRITGSGADFRGRGANVHDTRGCNACTATPPSRDEVKRRIDELVGVWKANFIRLDLESYAGTDGYRVHHRGLLQDPAYLADIKDIVAHVRTKPGVYLLVSLWTDPTFSAIGWPTQATRDIWKKLAEELRNEPHVLYGLVNEPQYNADGAQDAQVWAAMDATVAAIREVEDRFGTPYHVVAVQGTGGWSRYLDYYVTHPILAGGGKNIAYEVHVYDPERLFAERFEEPHRTLPVIIGEFGPTDFDPPMTLADCSALMRRAEAAGVPYLAWTFHMRCPPNLLVDNSAGGCGVNMPLQPTPWGQLLKDRLAQPWP